MRKGLLILLSLIMASQAMAGPAIRCEGVLLAMPSLSKFQEFRIARHDKGFDRALKRGDQYLEQWVADRFMLSYGRRLPLRDYIQLSKDERALKLQYRMHQEKIVVEGLDAYAKMMDMQISNGDKVNFAVRSSLRVFWKIISFPGIELRDTAVTSDMLAAWIRDGGKKHSKAIDNYLYAKSFYRPKGQSQLERYNYLKSAWVKIALLAWVYLTIVNWDEDQKEMQDEIDKALTEAQKERAEKVVKEFESDIAAVGDEIDVLVKYYIRKSFKLLYKTYLDTYHEEPTDEELGQMLEIAYKDFGFKNSKNEVIDEKTP
ncbi:hypothetical protein D3C72_1147110 [compost metagenome]